MKDILNVIKENTTSRLKNHIIGSYLFSWVLCHIQDILIFIMSPKDKQLELISSSSFDSYDDIAKPLFFMVLYLFVLPFLNITYERFFYFCQKKRIRIKNNYMIDYYTNITESNIAKVKSNEDHAKELTTKELESWVSQKRAIMDLKIGYSSKVKDREQTISNQNSNINILKKQLNGSQKAYNNLLNDNKMTNEDINTLLFFIDINQFSDETTSDELSNKIKKIRDKVKFDEEIPF